MDGIYKTFFAVGGAFSSFLWGGWSALLGILLLFVAFDFVSGVIAAIIEKKWDYKEGLMGITRKVFIFAIVAVAHQIDSALGDQHVFRDATVFFYLANELLSIIENSSKIGLPVPDPIKKAAEILKGKGGQGGN